MDFSLDCQGTSQYISAREVTAVADLERDGSQRLRSISNQQTTSFYVPLSLTDGHIAAAVIHTIPILDPPSRNPPFRVEAWYVPCHDLAQETPLAEIQEICRQIQGIYDVYIVATRWNFGSDCCWRRTAEQNPSLECHQLAQLAFDRLSAPRVPNGPSTDFHSDQRHTSGDIHDDTVAAHVHTTPNPHKGSKRQRVDGTAQSTYGHRNQQNTFPIKRTADTILSKIRSGMEKFPKGRDLISQSRKAIRVLEDQCSGVGKDKKELQKTLIRLENSYLKMFVGKSQEATLAAWIFWLYANSLGHILYLTGASPRHRQAGVVHVLFTIVNMLLPTEGVNSLAVLPALGADGLRGSLPALSDEYELFLPAAWISKVANIRIRDAYVSLGMPNLAVLGLDPSCSPTDAEKSIAMKQIRMAWSVFENDAKSKLAILQEALELFKACSFEELTQLACSHNLKDLADFSHLQQQIATAGSEHLNIPAKSVHAIIATEFGRIVVSWLDQRTHSEVPVNTDVMLHEHASTSSASSTAIPQSSSPPLTVASLSAYTLQQNSPSSSLTVLLEAARHTDNAAVQMPTNGSLSGDENSQISRNDSEDTNWMMEWMNLDVCNFGNVTSMTAHNGGLPQGDFEMSH
ncbi:hypothetical protein F5Y08DRAFT_346139 [Xylaria arbuscula]|nr:hypothetical protein F5Y08DRAFT_346139 [Xylaria arbuscula]